MSLTEDNKDSSLGVVSVVSGMICILPMLCKDDKRIFEHSRFSDSSFAELVGVEASFDDSRALVRNGEYTVSMNMDGSETLAYVFNIPSSQGVFIADPFVFFDDENDMFPDHVIAVLKGRHSNFLLRNCGILEGDSIIIHKDEYGGFDDYIKTFNRKNKAKVTVEYKPFGIPYLSRAKIHTIEKDGIVQTPIGDIFVLKTMDRDGDFEVTQKGNVITINKFNDREPS